MASPTQDTPATLLREVVKHIRKTADTEGARFGSQLLGQFPLGNDPLYKRVVDAVIVSPAGKDKDILCALIAHGREKQHLTMDFGLILMDPKNNPLWKQICQRIAETIPTEEVGNSVAQKLFDTGVLR